MATSCPTRGMQPWPSSPVASGLPLIETMRAFQAYDGVFHPDGGAGDAVERNILCVGLCGSVSIPNVWRTETGNRLSSMPFEVLRQTMLAVPPPANRGRA